MAPSRTCARAPDIRTSLYRLSETARILYPGSMYFRWPYRASTATSCSCVLMRESGATGAPATLQSPCYIVPQNSSYADHGGDCRTDASAGDLETLWSVGWDDVSELSAVTGEENCDGRVLQ